MKKYAEYAKQKYFNFVLGYKLAVLFERPCFIISAYSKTCDICPSNHGKTFFNFKDLLSKPKEKNPLFFLVPASEIRIAFFCFFVSSVKFLVSCLGTNSHFLFSDF